MKPVRLLLADDHPVMRAGLRGLFEGAGGFEVVGEASEGGEALEQVMTLRPDVLILDLSMAGMGGVEVAQRLQAIGCATRVLILSAYDDEAYVEELLAAGVAGYLTKDEQSRALVEAVRQIARGCTAVFSRSITARLVALNQERTSACSQSLSERELQVLRWLGQGLTNKQIAARLEISASTVKNHLANIYQKLNVHSRVEALLWLQRHDSAQP